VPVTRWRNPLAALFSRPQQEEFLAQYVIREHARGRALADVLEDRYVVNRSTAAERARLLERPEVIEAIGKHAIAEMRAMHVPQPR
jgi:hypothetical protein